MGISRTHGRRMGQRPRYRRLDGRTRPRSTASSARDDRGATWQQSGLEGISILQVAARPGAPAVFALADGVYPSPNLYVSRDGGQTWSSVAGQDSAIILGIDPQRPSTVYVGSASDGSIWKSSDAGANWQQVSTLPQNSYPRALVLNSNAIYVLTSGNLLYMSGDGGVNWIAIQPPVEDPTSIAAIAVGAAAGVVYAAGSQGFCRSADSAATWTCSTSLAPDLIARILEVPGDSSSTPRLLVSSYLEGAFLSRDRGATWTPAGEGLDVYLPALASDPSGSLVLAGTATQVFRSEDRGESWTASRAGLKSIWIGALALDPHDPSTIWAGGLGNYGSGPGLFRSVDAGLSWSPAGGSGGPLGANAIAIDPDHPSTIYAGWNAVFRTEDGGQTWTSSVPGPGQRLSVDALDLDSSQRIWVGAESGFFRSDDGARTWEPASIAQGIYCLLFDDRQPGTIYAGSYWDVNFDYYFDYYEDPGGSIWVSHDRGATFSEGAFDFPSQVLSIARDPFQDGVLYAGTAAAGAFRSADAGVTWDGASEGLTQGSFGTYSPIFQLVADPVRPGYLYGATKDGVFRTTDGARTWQSFSNGLAPFSTKALVISPDGRRMHAGTVGGGVFELDLEGGAGASVCAPSASRLCLVGGRYAVDLIATLPGHNQWMPGAARPLSDRSGYFALTFATGDPDLPEVVVKMLPDGTFGSSGPPVFYSSLTTLPYFLTVTDTVTGRIKDYVSNPSMPLCGGTDLSFGAPESSMSPRAAPLPEAGTALSLLGGRFSVTLEARLSGSGPIVGGVAMASGERFGLFSLPEVTGDPQFPEVVVKMIDARSLDGRFWFFHAGLTSLDYTLTVTDSVTGEVRTYESATPFCGAADTESFTDDPWGS